MDEESNSSGLTNTNADLESYLSDAAFPEDKFEKETSRVSIHVRSFRRLNADSDGISVKAALDGAVERGFLTNDSSKQVKSITSENFTGCGKDEERTLIIITEGD